jgi:hypothetical protein
MGSKQIGEDWSVLKVREQVVEGCLKVAVYRSGVGKKSKATEPVLT